MSHAAHYAPRVRELAPADWPRKTPKPPASPAVLFCWCRTNGEDAGQRKIARALAMALLNDEARRLPDWKFWLAAPAAERAT